MSAHSDVIDNNRFTTKMINENNYMKYADNKTICMPNYIIM